MLSFMRDGGGIATALAKDGLFDSPGKKADWAKLCDPVARAVLPSVFWTREMLPELCPWFESRFFGRHRTNYPLESTFSVYGQHVESAQAMELKEAIVRLTKALQHEKDARRAPEMRVPKKSAKAKERYEEEAAARFEEGKSEELERDSVSRKQLVMRGESLLARMMKANSEVELCSEIGMTPAAFYTARLASWVSLSIAESRMLEEEMKALRAKPHARARLTKDAFGRVRQQMVVRKSAAYMAQATAAEKAIAAATAELDAARGVELPDADASDVDPSSPEVSPTASPKKKKVRRAHGK